MRVGRCAARSTPSRSWLRRRRTSPIRALTRTGAGAPSRRSALRGQGERPSISAGFGLVRQSGCHGDASDGGWRDSVVVSSERTGRPDDDRRIRTLFGVSKQELEQQLAAQGISVEDYVRDHAQPAIDRVYDSYGARHDHSESLLPYWAPSAWIARGATKLAKSWLGEVSLEVSRLRLESLGDVLVEADPRQVHTRRVPIWFGMGVCLDLGAEGRWYVQPRYSPGNPVRAVRANSIFRTALAQAGAC